MLPTKDMVEIFSLDISILVEELDLLNQSTKEFKQQGDSSFEKNSRLEVYDDKILNQKNLDGG